MVPQRAEQLSTPTNATGIRSFVLTLVFVTVLTSLGVYQVWQRYQVYALGLQLSTETLQYRSLLEDNRKLSLELATMKRADRIRSDAADKLGMRIPAPQDVVEIR